jgi:hypothetical protein
VRRHPVAEGLEVAGERLLREPAGRERGAVVLVPVQTLAAGHDLHPPKEQVEAQGELGSRRVRVRVEGPLLHRIADDEEEVAPVLATGPASQRTFMGRRQIRLSDDALARVVLDQALSLEERHARDLGGELRKLEAEQVDGPGSRANSVEHPRERIADDRHDRRMILHEPELGVERDVLGEVAARLVRLGAEDGPGLVHALEHADEHLLVELRALREVRAPPEVPDLEHVRAALRRRGDELRCLDLGEAEPVERRPETRQRRGGDPEPRALTLMTKRDRSVVEPGRQLLPQPRPAQVDRDVRLGPREHAGLWRVQLGASGRLRGCGVAGDLDHGLERQLTQLSRVVVLAEHDLREALPVPEQDEGHAAELAAVLEPTREEHALAGVGRKLARRDAFHGGHLPSDNSPGSADGRRSRGATALCLPRPSGGGLVEPCHGGRPAGSTGRRAATPFFPRLGSVVHEGPKAAITAPAALSASTVPLLAPSSPCPDDSAPNRRTTRGRVLRRPRPQPRRGGCSRASERRGRREAPWQTR